MGLPDRLIELAKIVHKIGNIDLYRQLVDLSEQALDMQAEISCLKEENAKLKKKIDIIGDIEYHKTTSNEYPYITLSSDKEKIRFCAICWGKSHKLIPLIDDNFCIVCQQELNK